MTARTIANRLLEADEDFDVHGELERLTTTHPGYEIEAEGQHWNVYRLVDGRQAFIGEVTYDDMADMPKETMTPEQIAHWESHHWYTKAGWRDNEHTFCKTFDEAVNFIIAINTVKTLPVREAQDPDDPSANIERFARERSTPVEMRFVNHNQRPFRVKLVFDEPSHGTSYDADGKPEPPTYHPTVQFYDMTHASNPDYAKTSFKDKGQFVSSYYAATLMERPDGGLDLHGGEPAWQIDSRSMDQVRTWIKQEVEGRGYKLKHELFGMQYESEDPDDPDIYAHPERYTQQPSEEKIEGALRRKLSPYYTEVRVAKRPGLFNRMGRVAFQDSFIWTIHCNRDTPLPIPSGYGNVRKYGFQINWRAQAKKWFTDWAHEMGMTIFKFEIYGRLRKDPTFQFETVRLGPLKENEDDLSPEAIVASHVDKDAAQEDLVHALWKFHPYGTSYNALLGPRGGFVLATLYFPPEKDNFYKRFEDFVVKWITDRKLFQVTSTKLTGGKHVNSEPYPRWGLTLALNSDWPSDTAPYVPPTVEVGQPGAAAGESHAPQV